MQNDAIAATLADLNQRLEEVERKAARLATQANRPFMSASQAARFCRVRKSSLMAALKAGELRGVHSQRGRGGRGMWRIQPADVQAWIARLG